MYHAVAAVRYILAQKQETGYVDFWIKESTAEKYPDLDKSVSLPTYFGSPAICSTSRLMFIIHTDPGLL